SKILALSTKWRFVQEAHKPLCRTPRGSSADPGAASTAGQSRRLAPRGAREESHVRTGRRHAALRRALLWRSDGEEVDDAAPAAAGTGAAPSRRAGTRPAVAS